MIKFLFIIYYWLEHNVYLWFYSHPCHTFLNYKTVSHLKVLICSVIDLSIRHVTWFCAATIRVTLYNPIYINNIYISLQYERVRWNKNLFQCVPSFLYIRKWLCFVKCSVLTFRASIIQAVTETPNTLTQIAYWSSLHLHDQCCTFTEFSNFTPYNRFGGQKLYTIITIHL